MADNFTVDEIRQMARFVEGSCMYRDIRAGRVCQEMSHVTSSLCGYCESAAMLTAFAAHLERQEAQTDGNAKCGRCSHTALDHANFGKGECQVRSGCACFEFIREAQP